MSTQIWDVAKRFYVVDADHDGNADITDQPHVVVLAAKAQPALDAAEFEITDGYVGSFGVTFKPATAETLAHGYGVIRRKRTPQPAPLVRCSCGHSVPAAQVMNASLGTSCPDC